MGNTESHSDLATITVFNRSPHTVRATLIEDVDPRKNKDLQLKRCVPGSGGAKIITSGASAWFTIPDVQPNFLLADPFYDICHHRYISIEFERDDVLDVLYSTESLIRGKTIYRYVLITQGCDVTYLSDENIHLRDYPDLFLDDMSASANVVPMNTMHLERNMTQAISEECQRDLYARDDDASDDGDDDLYDQ